MYKLISDYTLWRIIRDSYSRRIILFADERHKKAILQGLGFVDVSVDYFVSECPEGDEKSVYDLMVEDYDDIMVIVGFDDFDKYRKLLEGLGLLYGINFKNLDRYSEECWNADYVYDPILGFTCTNPDYPAGYKIFGKTDAGIKILTLGGSTSDSYLYPFKSWPELMHDLLTENGVENIVYSGGCAAYTSGQELLKLIRDISEIEPDIVINYNGYNDCFLETNPYVSGYAKQICAYLTEAKYGKTLYTTSSFGYELGINKKFKGKIEDFHDFWIKNNQIMDSVCNIAGVKHISILQPSLFSGNKSLSEYENSYSRNLCYVSADHYSKADLANRVHTFHDLAADDIKKYDWLYDFNDIFDEEDVYYDICHVNENGNRILAQRIIDTLKSKKYL